AGVNGRLPPDRVALDDEGPGRPGLDPASTTAGGPAAPSAAAPDCGDGEHRHTVPLVGLAEHPVHGERVARLRDDRLNVHATSLRRSWPPAYRLPPDEPGRQDARRPIR